MDPYEEGRKKLVEVGKQLEDQLPGIETHVYYEYPTPEIHLKLERRAKFLRIFPYSQKLAIVYQSWVSKDRFRLTFPYDIDVELETAIKIAFEKLARTNPTQTFLID